MKSITDGKQITVSPYFANFTSFIIDYASKMGYKVLVFIVHKPNDYNDVKEIFYNKTIAAGIFVGQNNDDLAIKEIITDGYKVALIDQSINSDEDVYSKSIIVNADNFGGAYKATKYLINLNHTKIAHITGESVKFSTIERVNGYRKALLDANIPIINSLIVKGNFIEDGGYRATKRLLLKDKPTAIFLSNDKMAIGSLKAIKEAGLKVPDDISIIGFDDIEMARYLNPPLTTIRMALMEMASMVINALVMSIKNDLIFSANYTVPVALIERETCMKLKL